MAKGNYNSVYEQGVNSAPDWSGWVMQQEKMNLQQQEWNKQLKDEAEKKRKEKDDVLKKDLEDLGYGQNPEFKPTGIEALDYQQHIVAEQALAMKLDLRDEINKAYADGTMTPFKFAELKYKDSQIMKLPENLAAAQAKFKAEADEFVTGLTNGKYLKTPENQKRLKKLQDGDYSIQIDKSNPSDFTIVFDDGETIPMSEFMADKGIGLKIHNINMNDSAEKTAKVIGTMNRKDGDESNSLYTIETKGLKFNDKELHNFLRLQAEMNPETANSFAYQLKGKTWDELDDEEKDGVIGLYSDVVKGYVNEEYKREFNTGKANNQLGQARLAEQKRQNNIKNNLDAKKHEFEVKKWEKKNGGDTDSIYEGFAYYQDTDGEYTKMKVPAYGVNGYSISVDGKDIKINSIYAFPKSNGEIEYYGSDGVDNHRLTDVEANAIANKYGITREKIQKDYEKLMGINPTGFEWEGESEVGFDWN